MFGPYACSRASASACDRPLDASTCRSSATCSGGSVYQCSSGGVCGAGTSTVVAIVSLSPSALALRHALSVEASPSRANLRQNAPAEPHPMRVNVRAQVLLEGLALLADGAELETCASRATTVPASPRSSAP